MKGKKISRELLKSGKILLGQMYQDPCGDWWTKRLDRAYQRNEDNDAVIGVWSSWVETSLFRADFRECLTNAFKRKGGSQEVTTGYKRLITKHPSNDKFREELAKAYEENKRFYGAVLYGNIFWRGIPTIISQSQI